MIKKYKIAFYFALLLFPAYAFAQKSKKANVMDFDDDIVGGRGESLFSSIVPSSKGAKLDSILYLRKNFNEFYKQEFTRGKRGGLRRKRLYYRRLR